MNFDDVKENMQPLPTGRNPSILQALMRVESPQELQSQRRELEKTINEYSGDDPLEPWFAYISWIEQSFPSGGKESGLEEVLMKCLSRFEGEERYYQDRRMIKLYIKFIDSHKNPTECYQQLHNAGIGTMVADLYICWAYYYDLNGNTRRADEIFRLGLACRAQPIEELKEAHQHFGFSVAQRVIYQDDDNAKEDANRQLQDRRFALTSLRGYRRKAAVGSIRTGGAVKSLKPGVIQDEASSCARHFNAQVQVFSDENKNPNKPSIFVGSDTAIPTVEAVASAAEDGRSVVRSIIDAARNQENQKEPGPWNRAHEKKKSGKLFGKGSKTTDYGFSILEDDASTTTATSSSKLDIACRAGQPLDPPIPVDTNCDMSFKYPAEFYGTNKPQSPWHTPVTIENEPENALPEYDKNMLYPRPHMEFQLEEYLAYKYYTNRGLKNAFTEERAAVWSTHDIEANVRQYPNFAKKSRPQKHDDLDIYYAPPKDDRIKAPLAQIYNDQAKEEFQLEELLAAQWLLERNDTIVQPTDMEETVCGTNERLQRRKSFFPLRKSIAPNNYRSGMANIGTCTTKVIHEENESMATENEEIETACVNLQKSTEEVGMQVSKQEKFSASTLESSLRMLGLANKNKEAATETSGEKIMRNEKQAIVEETSTVVPPFAPFEIYQDATQTAAAPVRYQNERSPSDAFQFKTPALPAIAKSTSSAFEIYNENPATSPSKPAAGITSPDMAGMYDAEETCSTQTFNIFLRSQSVSTPKMAQKTAPRQFGTLLQEIPVPSLYPLEESAEQTSNSLIAVPPPNTKLVVMPPESCTEAVVVSSVAQCYSSPHGKQLSTILETSEHATTQGTHTTTGASTKSTFSSPENDNEANAACLTMPHRELEPLQEQSKEYSTTSSKVERHSASFKLSMLTKNDVPSDMSDMTKPAENLSTLQTLPGNSAAAMSGTPGAVRLHAGGLPDFSIFCDTSVSLAPKQTGNFSRLEEREDTASAAYALRPVRFQEDKTGTIPKILLTSQQHSTFQEDETETISKILFAPTTLAKFEEDKTQTIPKITLTGVPCPTPYDVVNIDDSFEFFGESPPKAQMRMKAGLADSSASASAHKRTPLMSNAKRYCDKDTPELHSQGSRLKTDKNNSKIKGAALFPEVSKAAQQFAVEDSCIKPNPQPKETAPDSNQAPTTARSKAPFRDFFMPDFSLTEEIKPTVAKSHNKNDSYIPNLSLMEQKQSEVASTKCILRDSFVTDFSLMEEKQPQSHVMKSSKKGRLLLPGFSLIQETQPQATKPNDEVRLRDSFVPDFSLIEETQPQSAKPSDSQQQLPSFSHASVIKHTPPSNSASSVYNQPQTSDSFLTDFSMVMSSQPPNESASRWRQQPTPVPAGDIKADNKHMLSDFFMKDFSMSKEPPKQQRTSSVALNRSSTLKFLNDFNAPQVQQTNNSSLNQSAASVNKVLPTLPSAGTVKFLTDPISGSAEKQSKLSFLATAQLPAAANSEQYFELNAETEMFATNNSMIGNSTWLPHLCSTGSCKRQSQIKETSLHIKVEAPSPSPSPQPQSGIVFKPPPPLPSSTAPSRATHASKLSFLGAGTRTETKTETDNAKNNSARISSDVGATELAMLKRQKQISPQTNCVDSQQPSLSTAKQCLTPAAAAASHADDDDTELSIYFKTTPKTPTAQVHTWSDEPFDNETTPQQNNFVHPEVDLDQTQHLINNICVDPNVNPFNTDLINAFLEQIDFSSYIEQLPTCMLVGRIARLQPANTIKVHQTEFKVMKLVGEGAYGAVYCAKETKTGKLYALKQERPPNYWEYYVCLEVQSRLKAEEMLPAFMSVDYALIGNNSSILISPYTPFGSIISVCNKVKKRTMKNVDEYVVMVMVCELLEIIDHLHAVQIIHADIKADNVLVTQKLCYKGTKRSLQLIDYGVSIDMKHFKAGQTFTYVNQDNAFKCIEMREQRAWTYQLDLFGLAGIIHVLLFGKYMEVERRPNNSWMHKTHVPRYYNKVLWESIFQALLNVRDCRTLPNLQQLRVLLKQELVEKENYVCCKLEEFNRALQS